MTQIIIFDPKKEQEAENINALVYPELYRTETGSYAKFFMKEGKRELTPEEADQVKMHPDFERDAGTNIWRTNYFPLKAQAYLEAAGFKVKKKYK